MPSAAQEGPRPDSRTPGGQAQASSSPAGWLLLIYRIPTEPSRHRVAVWRRLKEAGAVYLQSSVCVLPSTTWSHNLFGTLAAEIEAVGGETILLAAQAPGEREQAKVVSRFNAERDSEYAEVLEQAEAFLEEIRRETERQNFTFAELEENEGNLERLRSWAEKVRGRDFFGAGRAGEVESALTGCEQALEGFAGRVFAAQQP